MTVLGLRAVKVLSLSFSLVDELRTHGSTGFDHTMFWRRSVVAAAAARAVARRCGRLDHEEAFLSGMLHGIGIMALDQAFGARFRELIAAAAGSDERLRTLEYAQFGLTHADVSAGLTERWGLPPHLVAGIGHYPDPDRVPDGAGSLAPCVALGSLTADVFERNDVRAAVDAYRARAQQWFGLTEEDADRLLAIVEADAIALRALLDLPGADAPSVSEILAQRNEVLAALALDSAAEATQLAEQNERLAADAMTDSLTGLANRRQFDGLLKSQVQIAHRYGIPFCLMLIDVDRFKLVNDTHGHPGGDAVLQHVASLLQQTVRAADLAARVGGDEFAVVLPATPLWGAMVLAERIRSRLAASRIVLPSGHGGVTVSIGAAACDPAKHPDAASVLAAADEAVYAAKTAGGNAVRPSAPGSNVA